MNRKFVLFASIFFHARDGAKSILFAAVMEYEGFKLVCDAQSLLYLFGMKLDYSDALVNGGFQFQNPNAQDTCGCGKSFGV
jgi:iron-sulfur cluster assembly protein